MLVAQDFSPAGKLRIGLGGDLRLWNGVVAAISGALSFHAL
jgi:hypothetical protein